MKKIIAASAMAMVLATGASAELNVGLGFAAGASNAEEAAGVRVPIDFDFGLRIEPELGFSKHLTTLAVGGYYTLAEVEKVNLFVGGRLGFTKADYATDPTGISIQALVGAEHFIVENKFSVAVQVGLESATGDLNKYNSYNSSTNFGTTGAVIGHYFF